MLSDTKPAGVVKMAADVTKPLYGTIDLNGKKFLVLVDEPAGKASRLFVDSSGAGDLSQPATEWKARPYQDQSGGSHTMYMGSASLALGIGGSSKPAAIGVYRFDPADPGRPELKTSLFFYPDFAYDGQGRLGGKTYHVMVHSFNGDYSGKPSAEPGSGLALLIDVNHNGKFDNRGESFDASKPFNIGGTTYEIANFSAATGTFEFVKSKQTVAEILPPPDMSTGNKILNFTAKTTDGKSLSFPSAYKGKVVLLDFWATWCGPCMGEVPNVVSVYNKLHGQGFEILGVSLDTAETLKNLDPVTKDKGMTWTQIADGHGGTPRSPSNSS